ncbi:unnamed protein product [Schistosoma curassoni]|uniref:Reverse transcriptase domain-containing protein n=1 Tax=Schistosoma curassoni TaxID=6186 RepID=A0A183K756_9TREM|nr:unnamed protein product [Schistosoma curassoni]
MQLDDLDFAHDLVLLSHMQQQMQEKTTNVAAAAAVVGLNIHKGKSKILQYNTACTNKITLDGEDLEDVKTFIYLYSTDEHGRSDAGVKVQSSISTVEEHLELKTIGNQHQGQNFQYKCQNSSTVWDGNLENIKSHHPEDTSVY